MARKYALILAFAALYSSSSLAQQMSCGSALSQLQMYANQVNSMANAEFNYGIPGRCQMNLICRQNQVAMLNNWYMGQANMVNGWYSTLVSQCTARPTARSPNNTRPDDSGPGELDVASIEDLKVDDEDKTVRIRIPSNPRGYR